MSGNLDTTDSATKPRSSCPGKPTLESDCCISTGFGRGEVPLSHQRGYCGDFTTRTSSGVNKSASSIGEDCDSGVGLFVSKTLDEKAISYDDNGRSEIKEKRRNEDSPEKCKRLLRGIGEQLSNLHVGSQVCSAPSEAGHNSKDNDDDADNGRLFNWDIIFQQDQDGDTQLHIAVMLDTQLDFALSVINFCLATHFLDLQNDHLQTALHLAVILSRTRVIQALVSRGAALFICDLDGNTPLHLACQMGYTDAVHVLTQRYQTQSEKLVLQRIIHHRNYEGLTCCHLSAKSSAVDSLFHLIQDCGADINIQEGKRGMTVLHMAAESNNLTLVTFLVECPGIILNQFTYDGWTALDLAMGRCWKEMENELRIAGAWHNEETDTSSSSSQSDEEFYKEEIDDLEIFECISMHTNCNKINRQIQLQK